MGVELDWSRIVVGVGCVWGGVVWCGEGRGGVGSATCSPQMIIFSDPLLGTLVFGYMLVLWNVPVKLRFGSAAPANAAFSDDVVIAEEFLSASMCVFYTFPLEGPCEFTVCLLCYL